MQRSSTLFAALALAAAFVVPVRAADDAHPTLALGSAAPDFSLPGIDGKTHTLAEYAKSKVLVVIFTCNHCPTAQLYETRVKMLVEDYKDKDVAFVAIEPNSTEAVQLAELAYTDVGDGFEDMKIRADYRHFNFPYLYDGASQRVSVAYGPKATPHVFIFDAQRKLRYEGRIDSSQRESLVKTRETRDAITALLADKPVATPHTGVFGCSTKWLSKSAQRLEELKKIEAEPVTVDPISADGLKKLRQNDTGKLLLVNFWATWCGPCLIEFPDLQATYRMFRHRDFDMAMVAANLPDEVEGVGKVLARHHASSRNYRFASDDTYAMQTAFDARWDSGVPYTMLIAPGGKVLYEKTGGLDILELRRVILANLPDSDYVGHRAYWATK